MKEVSSTLRELLEKKIYFQVLNWTVIYLADADSYKSLDCLLTPAYLQFYEQN